MGRAFVPGHLVGCRTFLLVRATLYTSRKRWAVVSVPWARRPPLSGMEKVLSPKEGRPFSDMDRGCEGIKCSSLPPPSTKKGELFLNAVCFPCPHDTFWECWTSSAGHQNECGGPDSGQYQTFVGGGEMVV